MAWLIIVFYCLFLLGAGYSLPLVKSLVLARAAAWAIALITVVVSVASTTDIAPLFRMFIIAVLQLLAMKVIVSVETYRGGIKLNPYQWLAFALGWFGMRPAPFERLPSPALPGNNLLIKGLISAVLGLVVLFLSAVLERLPIAKVFFISQFLLVAGLSMIVFFGLFNVVAALWRYLGVDVAEQFRGPLYSSSLKEFWGKRWNVAFSDMGALIVFRPLRGIIGPANSVVAAFLLSGLLYEVAISFPVDSGYGLPFLYFVIQTVVMELESSSTISRNILRDPVFSRLWVYAFVLLPLPLLFHPDFVRYVLIPFRELFIHT